MRRMLQFVCILIFLCSVPLFAEEPNWSLKTPADTPISRNFPGMTFDGTRREIVLFGGNNGSAVLNDTWIWDGTNWTQKNPLKSPTPRTYFDSFPVWSPDGGRIVFRSNRKGHYDLYQKASGGAGNDEPLVESDQDKTPQDWSSDGRY